MAALRLLEVSPETHSKIVKEKHSIILAQPLVLLEGVLAVVVPATLAAPVDRDQGSKHTPDLVTSLCPEGTPSS